jgi:phosphohistidine phosphatase
MRLYLLQHGDAVTKDVDPNRPLTDKGAADIGRLASWLRKSATSVTRILHSGKLRAEQTAEILAPLLEDGGIVEARPGLSPNDSPRALLDSLGDEDVIVAGHMPFVSRAVSMALDLSPDHVIVAFKPGSVAVIEQDAEEAWRLVAFIRPEHL